MDRPAARLRAVLDHASDVASLILCRLACDEGLVSLLALCTTSRALRKTCEACGGYWQARRKAHEQRTFGRTFGFYLRAPAQGSSHRQLLAMEQAEVALVDDVEDVLRHTCATCGSRQSRKKKMVLCKSCRAVAYCSRWCRQKAWHFRNHKEECQGRGIRHEGRVRFEDFSLEAGISDDDDDDDDDDDNEGEDTTSSSDGEGDGDTDVAHETVVYTSPECLPFGLRCFYFRCAALAPFHGADLNLEPVRLCTFTEVAAGTVALVDRFYGRTVPGLTAVPAICKQLFRDAQLVFLGTGGIKSVFYLQADPEAKHYGAVFEHRRGGGGGTASTTISGGSEEGGDRGNGWQEGCGTTCSDTAVAVAAGAEDNSSSISSRSAAAAAAQPIFPSFASFVHCLFIRRDEKEEGTCSSSSV